MANMANRRAYPRWRTENRVQYSMIGSEEYHDASLVDVGEGGLCMEVNTPLRTGTMIYMRLLNINPDVSGLAAHRTSHGRVRWSRDLGCTDQTRFGIGVQYTHPICH
jgi:hypothetical protein